MRLKLWVIAISGILLAGCGTVDRDFTIRTEPVPAQISIDGADRGLSPVHTTLRFEEATPSHQLLAQRLGYEDRRMEILRDSPLDLVLHLDPISRRVTVNVSPPAQISIVGAGVPRNSDGTVPSLSATLTFTLDNHDEWTAYKVTATREGWRPASTVISGGDAGTVYNLKLEPIPKEVRIFTTPPGARLWLDGVDIGISPVTRKLDFSIDPATFHWNQYLLKMTRIGYDSIEDVPLSWDDGQTEYVFNLKPKQKTVRLESSPPGAVMTLDGKELARDGDGASVTTLSFKPNDRDQMPTYTIGATKKTADTDWYPATQVVAWDDGKTAYTIKLIQITEVNVDLLRAEPKRDVDAWTIVPKHAQVLAMKELGDSGSMALKGPVEKVRSFADMGQLDTFTVSPDGSRIVATVLAAKGSGDLRSQIVAIKADGTGDVVQLTDGRSLDLQPCFNPDGKQIVYSSNRGGRKQGIWSLAASGSPGITPVAVGDTNDLWPSIDVVHCLYYEALMDSRSDPRIYRDDLAKTPRLPPTDLTRDGGSQPQVNAVADMLLFVAPNAQTGKRELFKMSLKDGTTTSLTHWPDADNYDPAWSPTGDRIAFVSDRGLDAKGRHNLDIWIMDPNHPEQAVSMTTNGSQDDSPVWDPKDPTGSTLYFRSNRGGAWAIWRAEVKPAANGH